jgi:hypothetical protein
MDRIDRDCRGRTDDIHHHPCARQECLLWALSTEQTKGAVSGPARRERGQHNRQAKEFRNPSRGATDKSGRECGASAIMGGSAQASRPAIEQGVMRSITRHLANSGGARSSTSRCAIPAKADRTMTRMPGGSRRSGLGKYAVADGV